jgi:aryl-alcohol dehydrogenase-like predicted oxidoreductase
MNYRTLAVNLGINIFDLSSHYRQALAEERLGEVLRGNS